jgi:hypothetical protein
MITKTRKCLRISQFVLELFYLRHSVVSVDEANAVWPRCNAQFRKP